MSKKRPTESSWDSDEELLNDTSENAITAFPKTSELDLLGDDGELDEDALLGVDETGAKTTTISFANDSLWNLTTRQRSKNAISHQEHADHDQESHVSEQAFVFEETDTADLEDELNVGVQEEDSSGYHVGGGGTYTRNIYRQGVSGRSSNEMSSRGDYTDHGMNAADGGEMGYLIPQSDQAAYGDESVVEFGDTAAGEGYMGDASHESHEDASGIELEYEQPVEHDDQVHLEYEDSHPIDHEGNLQSHEPNNPKYESESDSDDEGSRHSRGKFTSERTGVISLTPANTREAIPDTLEINDEQAAQIEQFMTDKTQRVKGRGRGQSRPSAHSRLGSRSRTRPQQNPKVNQGPRMGQFPRGVIGQNIQMRFPFQGGPPNRGPFPGGLLNPHGPFPLRLLNQRGQFSGPQNQRQSFPLGPGAQRGPFPIGPLNMLLGGGLQRGPFPQERFPGAPNQRGPFAGGPQSLGSQRMPQQNLRNVQQGPQRMRGPPPNQLRSQGSFNQRAAHQAQFRQRPPHMGQMGARMPGPRNAGPRPLLESGPRPLLGPAEPGMRFVRGHRPPAANQKGQPIPSLIKSISGPGKSPQGNQLLRPGQQNSSMPQDTRRMPPDARRIPPHQRLGPVLGQNRFQNPTGQPPGPRFMARSPASGGPFMNSAFQGNQQPVMGQGDINTVRKHKIYINPRFQGQQETGGTPALGRTVKMGVPIQQKKAKVLLERAIQTQNKQAPSAVSVAQAGVKRKSTGEESVPSKIMKSDVAPPGKLEASSRVVQASSDPPAEDSHKMKDLLEEQRRQRELIQRKKELARQKQAAIKRKELETRLKEEGKTIDDILGTAKTEAAVEQKQVVPVVKQISGSVAARLGPPPPNQQQTRGPQQQESYLGPSPAKMRPPVPRGPPGPVNNQQFPGAPRQPQSFQARTPVHAPTTFPNQPKVAGPSAGSDASYRVPPPNNSRSRKPSLSIDPRFQAPPPTNQFKTPQPDFDKRQRAPQPPQDHTFRDTPSSTDHRIRGPPPMSDHRLRGPPPMTDHRITGPPPTTDTTLRGPPHQASIQASSVSNHSVIYSIPPPASQQNVRFQTTHSAPPQVQVPASQQFPPQYTPSSAPPSHPPSHYPPPSQSDAAGYASAPQYTPQVSSYQHATYTLPAEHHYQLHTHQPPPSQPFTQSVTSQYQLHPQQQYQTPDASQYQAVPAQPQYQTPPPQLHYQTPSAQPQYHVPPAKYQASSAQSQYQAPPPQPQYQTSTAQPHYQAPPPQPQYQTSTAQQYQSSAHSYSAPTDMHYQQVSYYSEPQPIQTVTTSQTAATPSPVGDQRTVQHHTPVGQRIQTIGQRVQPASVAHMRSIIHNVAAQPDPVAEAPPARRVQSQTAVSRAVTDGQVSVLDGPQKILIQNVPAMATKETLIKICRHFGQVLGVNLMSDQNKAVVQFQKGEQAAKCVAKCNQKCLHKTRLTVKLLPG